MRLVSLLVAVLLSGCSAGTPSPDWPALVLRDDPPFLLVEVDAVAGLGPTRPVLDAIGDVLANVTAKHHVVVVGPTPMPAQGGDYDTDQLIAISHQERHLVREGAKDWVHLHVMFLDGGMVEPGDGLSAGGRVLGRAVADVIAIFPEAYAGARKVTWNGSVPAEDDMAFHVLLHELGHVMGLVGDIPETRARQSEVGHSINPGSVMYANVALTPDGMVAVPSRSSFDADDLADLRAYARR